LLVPSSVIVRLILDKDVLSLGIILIVWEFVFGSNLIIIR
jgi:hypothetical protein